MQTNNTQKSGCALMQLGLSLTILVPVLILIVVGVICALNGVGH